MKGYKTKMLSRYCMGGRMFILEVLKFERSYKNYFAQ
jgi:hypothetical protein